MSAPTMPMRIVTMNPPGSFPGIKNFAIAPTMRPMINIQRKFINLVVSGRVGKN
jgi:hypothetical protein